MNENDERRVVAEIISGETYFTASEAAKLLCVTPRAVRKWTERGYLSPLWRGKRMTIRALDLVDFLSTTHQRTTPARLIIRVLGELRLREVGPDVIARYNQFHPALEGGRL